MADVLQLPVYTVDGTWDGNTVDGDGVEWWVSEEEGWSNPPEVRLELAARPQRDGSFDAPSFKAARVITLSGTAIAPDPAVKERAKDRLAALLFDGSRLADLTVREIGGTRRARVRLSSQTKIADQTPYTFAWSLQLTAPDPLRYGTDVRFSSCGLPQHGPGLDFPISTWPVTFGEAAGGSLLLENAGTVTAWPVWTITGPCDQPVVRNAGTGKWLAFGLTLAAGESLTVDTAARTVRLGGVSRRATLRPGSTWFGLPGGRTVVTFDALRDDTTATLSAAWQDTWI